VGGEVGRRGQLAVAAAKAPEIEAAKHGVVVKREVRAGALMLGFEVASSSRSTS
jgi:DNA-binding transcriptional regulator YdaS (Cro superfamily)